MWVITLVEGCCNLTTVCKVDVEGHNLENVREAVYLGMKLSEGGRMEGELERRIGIAMTTVGAMKAKVFVW